MPDRWDAIYLSPHLDDAVLSCGGQIANRARQGDQVLVLTVFAGHEPEPPYSDLVERVHEIFRRTHNVIRERRREDTAACEHLGAEPLHWDIPEAIYRRDADGRDLYDDLDQIFREPRPADDGTLEDLAARFRSLPEASQIVVPLGVGGHVDHRLVRLAAERELEGLVYYEDIPYAERGRTLRRTLADHNAWTERTVAIEPEDLRRKIEACAAYRSQIRGLYKTPDRMARKMRRRARKLGGERLWERR